MTRLGQAVVDLIVHRRRSWIVALLLVLLAGGVIGFLCIGAVGDEQENTFVAPLLEFGFFGGLAVEGCGIKAVVTRLNHTAGRRHHRNAYTVGE